ncbi:hypothetical protein [Diplocloster agilis]|nr:hypothetical protein [Diplocloster agilis]
MCKEYLHVFLNINIVSIDLLLLSSGESLKISCDYWQIEKRQGKSREKVVKGQRREQRKDCKKGSGKTEKKKEKKKEKKIEKRAEGRRKQSEIKKG